MAKIFVSYAHEDQAAAKRIVDALAREGLDAWWDHEIPPGRTWDEIIGSRIKAARVTIVVWSRRSVASDFVKEEAQIAYEAGKFLPVRIDDVEPPIGFRRTHAANLIGWRGEGNHPQWGMVVSEIHARLGGVAPTKPMRRASSYKNGGGSFALGMGAAIVLAACVGATWLAFERGGLSLPSQPSEISEASRENLSDAAQSAETTSASPTANAAPPIAASAAQNQSSGVDARAVEIEFWRSCCGDANASVEDYGAYLERYPNGEFAALARQRVSAPQRQAQSPNAPELQAPSIIGTWRGQVSGPNVLAAGFRFHPDGSADILSMPNGQWTGSPTHWGWRQDGANVRLTFYYDTAGRGRRPGAVLSGTIEGEFWSGTYTHDGQSYPFRYQRQ